MLHRIIYMYQQNCWLQFLAKLGQYSAKGGGKMSILKKYFKSKDTQQKMNFLHFKHLPSTTFFLVITTFHLVIKTFHLVIATLYLKITTFYLVITTFYLVIKTFYLVIKTLYLKITTLYLVIRAFYLEITT